MRWSDGSLRTKLIVACVAVQITAAALLVFGSNRLLQQTLHEQARTQAGIIATLIDQSIAAPLAQRDYATLQQTIDLIRNERSINYLAVSDHRNRLVASAGPLAAGPLPPRDQGDIDLTRADETLHLSTAIELAGQRLGKVDFGLSTHNLRRARADFIERSRAIGVAALIISVMALTAIAFAITRHLRRLALASQRVAQGDFEVQVPVTTQDEIGRLAHSFNSMAAAVKQRVVALEASEAQQRQNLQEARDEQSRLTTLLGAMPGGIVFVDAQARVLYANASFARIWSIASPATGQPLSELVPLLIAQTDPTAAAHLEAMLQPSSADSGHTQELHTRDGRVLTQRMQSVVRGNECVGCIWFHDDITLERQIQQRAYQALHDPLTALLNRRGLYESLHPAFAQAAAQRSEVSLLFIDLDDFKQANDLGGHRTGDQILMAVARTLTGLLRKGEILARLGGDEFAVLCPRVGANEAGPVASRIVEAIAALRFQAGEHSLRVGCSIGVATYPTDACTEDDLIACADAAMYEAKRGGKNGWASYRDDPLRVRATVSPIDWPVRIDRALQDQRFVLHFQSVHRASDLRLSHHEALVRMIDESDPTRLIPPAEFMPDARRSGQIRLIDRWVFETCVRQLATTETPVRLAANLSPQSLQDPGFASFLGELFERYQVDPQRLHIELSDILTADGSSPAGERLEALRSLGCALHLDDFGNGLGSFAQLDSLAVDAIKIDGYFIRGLLHDPSHRLFVASMIGIAHQRGRQVVAEHVEDMQTLEDLRELGVDLVQGFFLSRPSVQLSDPGLQALTGLARDARRQPRLTVVASG